MFKRRRGYINTLPLSAGTDCEYIGADMYWDGDDEVVAGVV